MYYRATALGIAVAGSGLGGVVYPVVLQGLFSRVGFGWGVRISGLVSGVGCVAATIMVSSLSLPKKPGPYFDIKTVADRKFLLLAAGSFFVALVDYARSLSIPEHTSFYVLAVMNAGGVLGRLAPPYMSDTLGRFNLLVPCAFVTGLSCVVFWVFAKTVVSVMLFAATYGFFSGAFISLVNPCVAQISDIRQIGTRIGMLYTIISFPSLIGGPAAGALLAHYHGSFTAMIAFAGTTVIVGSVLLLGAKLVVDRNLLAKV
ncbi:hypothetical protein D9613_012085 [Agrocybe pediades]|uniref:Major facilitator superfamily (MFS) profile domain-containing protein n=1 Tax=Agrocybe pediades TaxID=84607 RepID=A0A8H4R3M5_9AGAR|nr:hypothetical protein D9613_012085 [Agrocybe pediades]